MSSSKTQTTSGKHLPLELWVEVISFLPHADLARALCTCRALARVGFQAWRAACYRRWPAWAPVAEEPHADWRRTYELLLLRESERHVLVDVAAARKQQNVVTERHRTILVEWLCEVSFEWKLDSPVVFEAVKYLDYYLLHNTVERLGRFQLLGLACLRAAMRDAPRPPTSEAEDKLLDAGRFSYISDDTYTPDQVEEFTKIISAAVPPVLRECANARMFLRSFWFRATQRGVASKEETHIYMLASFLLQLSLMDLNCSGFAPSLLSAASLSMSLSFFGKDAWPAALESFGAYKFDELQAACRCLAAAQLEMDAVQLRRVWRRLYNHGLACTEFVKHWTRLEQLFARPSPQLLGLIQHRNDVSLPGSTLSSQSSGDAVMLAELKVHGNVTTPMRAASPTHTEMKARMQIATT